MSSSVTEASGMLPNKFYEWPDFNSNMQMFFETILVYSTKKFDFYYFNSDVEIYSHDDVVFQTLTICNEIFTKRILSDQYRPLFHSCPNRQQIKGDIFFKDCFFIEVKTPKTLKIKTSLVEDFRSNMYHAKKAIQQTFDYMYYSKVSYALLSTYESTWLLNRINKTLFISPVISKKSLILAIYYALALRDKSISEATTKLHLDSLNKFNEKNKLGLKLDEDCSEDIAENIEEEELAYEALFINDELKKEFSIESLVSSIRGSIRSGVFIGSGVSGVVVKVNIGSKTYALKMIDLYKEAHSLPEIKNEIKILQYLNSLNVDRIPIIYFGGRVDIRYFILMNYIQGEIKSFEEMNENEIKSCIECVSKLHQNLCLHRDLRSENFIINNEQAYIIDYGRARILDDSFESHNLFKDEMNELDQLIRQGF